METVTLEDVRAEVSKSLTAAIDSIDWRDKLGLASEDSVAPVAQEPPSLPPAFSRLGEWISERGDKPLGDDEVLHFREDDIEILPAGELASMAQRGGAGGLVSDLDNVTRFDIPFGSVIFGALPGAAAGEIVDGLMPLRNADGTFNIANPITKGVGGFGGAMFADRLVGRRAAGFFVGALLLQIVVDAVPLDRFVDWAVDQFSRDEGTGAAGQFTGRAGQGDLPIREASGGNPILRDLAAA